jgi:hypothetical protein
MAPDRPRARPSDRTGPQNDARGDGTTTSIARYAAEGRPASCPWLRGAQLAGDPAAVRAVLRLHPPSHCPAARRTAPHVPGAGDAGRPRPQAPGRPHQVSGPSDYSLTQAEMAGHARQLRRDGWQPWEIRVRFDVRTAA